MIGVLGGTFDPIHFGHLRPALDCLQALSLDEVRLVPLKQAVHRPQPRAPADVRLAMVRAAVAGVPGMVADGRELARVGASYSYDTLASLRLELGQTVPICLLVGADAFNGFLSWHRPVDILDLAHLVVMERPEAGSPDDPRLRALLAERGCAAVDLHRQPAGCILRLRVTQLDISSSRIRALIAAGQSPRYLLPDPVLATIEREGLYREAATHANHKFPTPGAFRPAQTEAEESACSLNN
jgi:nicotinate-nucleotide adenylyltransferase